MTDTGADAAFLALVADRATTAGRHRALIEVARTLGRHLGVDLAEDRLRLFTPLGHPDAGDPTDDRAVPGPPGLPVDAGPGLLGRCLEVLLSDDQRTAGAHHTPAWLAARVVTLALESGGGVRGPAAGWTVCDPAVGGGAFLLAVADELHRRGVSEDQVVSQLWGFDTDPLAIAVTETALALWAGGPRPANLHVADFLLDAQVERSRPAAGWSLIVGNPPFQGQLAAVTARGEEVRSELRKRFGVAASGYVDTAAVFLRAGASHLTSGGRAAMIVPASVLASESAAPVRAELDTIAPLVSTWAPDRQPFGAAVDVAVVVIERGSTPSQVEVHRGREASGPPHRITDPGPAWSALLAGAEGAPEIGLDGGPGPLEQLAGVTAGFRQHFYALAAAADEGAAGPTTGRPVMTVGLVDPLTSHWDRRSTRLGGARLLRPMVDPDAVEDVTVRAWIIERLRPKLLVATQTRVVEVVADVAGVTVPCTPLISVEPHEPERDLWRLAAVLCAPPVAAWFHHRAAGTGLSSGRIRPSAALVRQVPLPAGRGDWDRAAGVVEAAAAADPVARRALLLEAAAGMTEAYRAPARVTSWWRDLLPAVEPGPDQ